MLRPSDDAISSAEHLVNVIRGTSPPSAMRDPLRLHKGTEAIVEFRKILDHPGIVQNCILGALAYVGIARAYAMRGDTALAKGSYSHILELWKSADRDIPILHQVASEQRKLRMPGSAS